MSISVKKILGYVWASPLTAFGLLYVGLFQIPGWYRWHAFEDEGLVWTVSDASPRWFRQIWSRWFGHTLGNVIVLNCDPSKQKIILAHEIVHVKQGMRLGIFYPPLYLLSSLIVYLGCSSCDSYWSNPFEIDARRIVGQPIDIEGAVRKLRAKQ